MRADDAPGDHGEDDNADRAPSDCDDADIDRRQAELVELETLLDDQDERVARLFHEREMADQAVLRIGGDGEVARLEEERQALLIDIEDRAERYLRLKIGSAAAEHALQLYRSCHQGIVKLMR